MEKMAVIANNKQYAEFLAEDLNQYFAQVAEIHAYSSEEFLGMKVIEEEIVVLSAFTIFQKIKKKVDSDKKIVIAGLTLSREKLNRLTKIPENAKAYLVNIDYRNCMEAITMIYQAGYKNLELMPYFPGSKWNEEITLAITPGEVGLVPDCCETVIDIGGRVLDRECIYKMGSLLCVSDPFAGPRGEQGLKNIVSLNENLEKVLGENLELLEQVRTLLKLMDRGIIITDAGGKIFLSNKKADDILSFRTEKIADFNIAEIIPEMRPPTIKSERYSMEEIIKLNGSNTIITVEPIILEDQFHGSVITLEPFMEAEKRQHAYRSKLSGHGHVAKYTFSDILGHGALIENAKQIAMRMAGTDSNIYLHGESGTGKELFAQSIHNASARKKYNFVAVNCSALPENLLESELYGYEPGAFSGAKKNGRIGLFELAHNGTLFLDEIGEMPFLLQAKLLRAIEEKKILKIGGTDLIDVDVRIITATNRDLYEMVQNHQFREDLYYRLCVLPIQLPALRDRPQDILEMVTAFKNELNADFILSDEAAEKLAKHRWPGNVREVRNVVEYLKALGKPVIGGEDLPLRDVAPPLAMMNLGGTTAPTTPMGQETIYGTAKLPAIELFILDQLRLRYGTTEKIGRKKLAAIAEDQGYPFTEQEIKGAMARMQVAGYVISGVGRKGTVITDMGLAMLHAHG